MCCFDAKFHYAVLMLSRSKPPEGWLFVFSASHVSDGLFLLRVSSLTDHKTRPISTDICQGRRRKEACGHNEGNIFTDHAASGRTTAQRFPNIVVWLPSLAPKLQALKTNRAFPVTWIHGLEFTCCCRIFIRSRSPAGGRTSSFLISLGLTILL